MFLFAYRLSYNNILDFTQWPCGISFSHFESYLAQCTYSRVRLKCTCDLNLKPLLPTLISAILSSKYFRITRCKIMQICKSS